MTEINEIDINDDGVPDNKVIDANSTNLYIDKDVDVNKTYIYALTCVDVHNLESFLSTQIQAQINPAFNTELQERPLKWISGFGARLNETDFVYKKFLSRNEQIIAKNNIKITVNTKLKDASNNFIVKIKSLDTHEIQEYKLNLTNNKV